VKHAPRIADEVYLCGVFGGDHSLFLTSLNCRRPNQYGRTLHTCGPTPLWSPLSTGSIRTITHFRPHFFGENVRFSFFLPFYSRENVCFLTKENVCCSRQFVSSHDIFFSLLRSYLTLHPLYLFVILDFLSPFLVMYIKWIYIDKKILNDISNGTYIDDV